MKRLFCAFLIFTLLCAPTLSACNLETNSPNNGTDSTSDTLNVDNATSDTVDDSVQADSANSGTSQNSSCNHVPVTDAAVPATCKSTGLTEGSHCSLCNKILVKQNIVPKTNNHAFVVTYEGQYSHKCSVCSKHFLAYGNADGSISGGNNNVKYYVAETSEGSEKYEIVIFGKGNMPDFSENPLWYDYLPHTVKIMVDSGITSIGKHTFYYNETTNTNCTFVISDTVKTIKSYAIKLKIQALTLGKGVTNIEPDGLDLGDKTIKSVYVPKSVKSLGVESLGNGTWFYEGSLEDFYKIKMRIYNNETTVKSYINGLDEDFISGYIHIYINAKSINDRSNYWR